MGSVFWRLSLKRLGEALPLAALIVFAVVVAFVAARKDLDRSVHEAIMMNLRAVDVNHAALQRDVLRARAGLLPSYDGLVTSVVNLRSALNGLSDLFDGPQFAGEFNLNKLLTELRTAIDRDEMLVESFKTRNALLQNSIGVFGQTLTSLHETEDLGVARALARVGDLSNLMMRFSISHDDLLKSKILSKLEQLGRYDTQAQRLESFGTVIIHAKMVLAVLPRVDSKISAIQASATPTRAGELQSEYLRLAADAASLAHFSRVVLGITAALLSIYICILIYRLRQQTQRLKRRLHYEQIVADMKADLVAWGLDNFPTFMSNALQTASCFFGARCSGFVMYDAHEELKDAYRVEGGDLLMQRLIVFAQDLYREKEPAPTGVLGGPARCAAIRHCNLMDAHGTCPSLLVGAKLACGDVAALVLQFDTYQPKVSSDETQLLQSILKTFIEFVEADKGRQEKHGLERRLEHAQRLEAVGTLAGGIAHEFNNVLGAILGYGEMAVQLLRKPTPIRHYVEEILKSGARAKHIVDQILTFSRKRERIVKPFDVRDAVADILPLLQVTLGNHVVIESSLCRGPAVVEGNPVEVHQLAMNLCKNASQASARGQAVKIEVNAIHVQRRRVLSHGEISPGSHVRLAVTDEGPGIPPHILPHIFEPFFTTNSRAGGSGLGLSAVHGIVSSLNGGINVRSAPAVGTTFEIFLPSTNLAPLPIDSFFNERAVATGNGQCIMIVENDKTLLELYEEKVAALGYEPIGCRSIGCLRELLGSERDADMLIVNRKCLGSTEDLAVVEDMFGQQKMLLLSERSSDLQPAFLPSGARVLRTPFSSAALANAIFDNLNRPSLVRTEVVSFTPVA
ncbi:MULTISPECIES: two-component system VirA-like sensor kinase [unclassified Sinorhizobium]|uniref:two-component system VirA-like sensor kinase n=1 Tax=unclassified Sinorhizobium TaxID=2613772 RepID=UPI0024C40E13|nr:MULTISPECIES: two-component system VirA-like sensor kinase [unclassified Sinorhizobium]MDK1374749.1 two-component system VirA-like sensor kinase [Sinorhizobium sp. 6-70]MDK1479068.1 two-component system VirA-like sensor kinase [Sinorhizobium sp. 6-117]